MLVDVYEEAKQSHYIVVELYKIELSTLSQISTALLHYLMRLWRSSRQVRHCGANSSHCCKMAIGRGH